MTDGSPESTDQPTGRLDALLSGVRFGQFASVGIVGAAVDMGIFLGLIEFFGVVAEVATVVGIEAAILVMFAINERWTFATRGSTGLWPTLKRLGRSHAVRAAGSTAQFLVLVALLRYVGIDVTLGGLDLSEPAAKACGMAVGMVLNYTFESLITWKVHLAE